MPSGYIYRDHLCRKIEERFPELAANALACGGVRYRRPSVVEPGVHVLSSPLPPEGEAILLRQLKDINPSFCDICSAAYLNVLREFNGADFYYPIVALFGLQAPREINILDRGFAPFSLQILNSFERSEKIPISELSIGVAHEPDLLISVDKDQKIRLRKMRQVSFVTKSFNGFNEFFDYLFEPGNTFESAWRQLK